MRICNRHVGEYACLYGEFQLPVFRQSIPLNGDIVSFEKPRNSEKLLIFKDASLMSVLCACLTENAWFEFFKSLSRDDDVIAI